MDQNSQLELDRILKLDPEILTADEIGFLRARRGYLTSEDKRIFAIHLEEKTAKKDEPVAEEAPVEEVKPQAKSKK